MRKVAGTEPAIGWTGQVRFNDDHHAWLRACQLPSGSEECCSLADKSCSLQVRMRAGEVRVKSVEVG